MGRSGSFWARSRELAVERRRHRSLKRIFLVTLAGSGQITAQEHLPAALTCAAVEVAALADSFRERAARPAHDYLYIPSCDRAPRGSTVDGAVIATPNHTHAELAIHLIEHDVAALVEKAALCHGTEGGGGSSAQSLLVVALSGHRPTDAEQGLASVRLLEQLYQSRVPLERPPFGLAAQVRVGTNCGPRSRYSVRRDLWARL